MRLRWAIAVGMCAAPIAGAQDDGKALMERVCSRCHSLEATVQQRNSRERWAAIVDDMVARGAEGSDAQFEKIVDYLAKNLGPRVAVNKAGAEQLAAALEIPISAADAIVAYRRKNGAFKALDDLKKVPALEHLDLNSKKDRLDFSEPK